MRTKNQKESTGKKLSSLIIPIEGEEDLPKAGFKSITVNQRVYDKFYQVYYDQKEKMAQKGVNSFAGYVTFCLEDVMKKDETFTKFTPKIEQLVVDDHGVILRDIPKNRIVEIQFHKNELFCMLCNANECKHVGFCDSLPEVLEIQGKEE